MKPESKEFLITEFNNTYEEWRRIREGGNNKIQFLLAVNTAVLGGVGLLCQFKGVTNWDMGIFALVGFSFLCLVAFQTFEFMISRAIASDLNTRALARIRRYFLDNDPDMLKSLTWQVDDGPTKIFLLNYGGEAFRTTQIIFSICIAGTLSSMTYLLSLNFYCALLTSPIWLIAAYMTLHKLANKRVKNVWEVALKQQRFTKIMDDESDVVDL